MTALSSTAVDASDASGGAFGTTVVPPNADKENRMRVLMVTKCPQPGTDSPIWKLGERPYPSVPRVDEWVYPTRVHGDSAQVESVWYRNDGIVELRLRGDYLNEEELFSDGWKPFPPEIESKSWIETW